MKHNFAYFIASYGKADSIPTLNVLKRHNHKYPVYIVVGDDDPQLEQYKLLYPDNLLVFSKEEYIPLVDDLGIYAKTHKVCTYSRLAIDKFARLIGVKYVGYLFDDIESVQLRYKLPNNKIASTKAFDIDRMTDLYIELLNSSDSIYVVGPPVSSFYIGVNINSLDKYSRNSANFIIYDIDKPIGPYKSNVMEDASLMMFNNQIGHLTIFPFGMQVNCRPSKVVADSYGSMSLLEFHEQIVIICQQAIDFSSNLKTMPKRNFKRFYPCVIEQKENYCGHKKRLI